MPFDKLWRSSLHKKIVFGSTKRDARIEGSDGSVKVFLGAGDGNYVPDAGISDDLVYMKNAGGGYRHYDWQNQALEIYDSTGRLTDVFSEAGQALRFFYSSAASVAAPAPGYLIQVQDRFGRGFNFQYELPAGGDPAIDARVSRITAPGGLATTLSYDAYGNLSRIRWPDDFMRQFVYERIDLPWALTGVVDENNVRTHTFGWDDEGRAISTEMAGGINRFSATYSQPPRVLVEEALDAVNKVVVRTRSWQSPVAPAVRLPNGAVSALGSSTILGMPAFSGGTQPAGSGCAASANAQTFDANGNLASADDFSGNRVCYEHDLSRNLEIVRVEGLLNTQACSAVIPANASLPPGGRRITTVWHPDRWPVAVQRAEPAKLITNVYNGQPDPFNGNAIARCAPSTAMLPDGKPIVVLCKRVEQATTDADGHLGLNAGLQAGTANVVSSWTYNTYGQVLSAKGPRSDVNDTTLYVYYADTTTDHTLGDLQSVTNAVGKTVTYGKYNSHGQVLQSTDANGVVTTNTYDLRQRLLSTTTAGETTSYSYDAAGQLATVTLPNRSVLTYTYDAAYRLTQVVDAAGNKVVYTLDDAGNRIAQQVKDASGVLIKNITRSFDELNRVQSISGAAR